MVRYVMSVVLRREITFKPKHPMSAAFPTSEMWHYLFLVV